MLGLLGNFFGQIYGGWWPGLLISVVLGIINVFILISTTLPWVRAHQSGITNISVAQVLGMQTVANEFQLYNIAGTEMYDTGIESVTTMNRAEVGRSYYGVLVMGDRLLLVNTNEPVDETITQYTGHFWAKMDEKLQGMVAADLPELQSSILPFYFIEQTKINNEGLEFFISVQVLLFAISLFGLWRFLTVTVFPAPETPQIPKRKTETLETEKLKIQKPRPAPQPDAAPKPNPKADSVPVKKPLKKL
jgi:hypothetical protein